MMQANQYPVTTPYGYVLGYPLHNGFHQGIDYGCPVGTPVVVNGVTIGLSGNTGYTSGPHLHLGKWLGGVVQNPLNGGFKFNSAVVSEIGEDADNGKYVRVQGDGYSWVYCHLSVNNLVKVGQELKGEIMASQDIADETVVRLVFNLAYDRDATTAELKARVGVQTVEKVLRDALAEAEHGSLITKARDFGKGLTRDGVLLYVSENLK